MDNAVYKTEKQAARIPTRGTVAYTEVYGLCYCGHLGNEHEHNREHTNYGRCYAIIDYHPDGTAILCGDTSRCREGFRRPSGYDPLHWPEEYEAELHDPGLARRLRHRTA